MSVPFFIAKRIYKDDDNKKSVSRPAIAIATTGVAIGIAVMIISVCIVLGFKHTIRDKAIGFGGHINVGNFVSMHGGNIEPICMSDSMIKAIKAIEGVKDVGRYAQKEGILKTDNDFLGVVFKGIASEYDTTFIHNNMVEGAIPHFTDSASSNSIIISKTMADLLRLKAGDKVFAYFINENVRVRRFTIAGIYRTNLTQYDKTICFTDLYTTVKLNGWQHDQADGAEVIVNDYNQINDIAERFVSNINRRTDHYGQTYSSATIQEINPQIFSWLDLLDLNVWIILALMLCVAGFTMISGLLIIILERTNMIGLLKAIGSRNSQIRKTFLWFATFIIGRGLVIGNIIGIGLMILQKTTGLIRLDASIYYVDIVPVEINIPAIAAINILTLALCLLALIAPSFLVSHIHPAKSMKYE
ncbi:MAG: FtsX-like permease family protein [Prevotella sp.]|nr:ABC transporter permease [Paraprevotella sp.]MDY4408548.1 FtsX-like permease family protein [Prevotella sp.]